ncbi:MAG: hypothetical protein K2N34_15585 [Lachnospiraceae bacterium]|nr:hypothetical protein [Lachnospiraceae bacterium]
MAHKKLMFCKGFYLGTGVPFYDDYFGYKPCAECKECKQYLYRKQNVNLFYAVAISFGILVMLILGTPQGAIRRKLLFHEGVEEAFHSNVERIEQEENSRNLRYSVIVNGEQQEWEVICLQTTYIARRLSE